MSKRETDIARGAAALLDCREFYPNKSEFGRHVAACVWSTRVWEAINVEKK